MTLREEKSASATDVFSSNELCNLHPLLNVFIYLLPPLVAYLFISVAQGADQSEFDVVEPENTFGRFVSTVFACGKTTFRHKLSPR